MSPFLRATFMTDVGRVRTRNEDTIGVPGFVSVGSVQAPVSLELNATRPLTFVVADGMGGHAGGQEASRLVASLLTEAPITDVARSLREANMALYERMRETPRLLGMGTTIAGLHVTDGSATVFNVGDARVYQASGGYLALLSVDDRVAEHSNTITQSLGGAQRPTDIAPHLIDAVLGAGDRVLICSDGLTGPVSFDEIRDCLKADELEVVARTLMACALDAGAPDNVSFVVVEVVGV